MPGPLFLDLPAEIRKSVYEYALPVLRLSTRLLRDSDFKLFAPERRSIPDLLFVSRQVYQETSEAFYAKAILEVAPPRPPSFMFSTFSDAGNASFDVSAYLDHEFGFLPRQHLRRITNTWIFSDQRDAISAEAYESTLKWLLQNTRVSSIHLSSRLMCRLRKKRIDISPAAMQRAYDLGIQCGSVLTVQVYSQSKRNEWDASRRKHAEGVLGQPLQELQLYFYTQVENGAPLLQADPRWDVRYFDTKEHLARVGEVGALLDRVAESKSRLQAPTCPAPDFRSSEDWLYQVIYALPAQ